MGVVRTALETIATAPIKYGGLGLQHIYEHQIIHHLHIMMQHGHLTTATENLIRITLENLSVESGIDGDPMAIKRSKARWTTRNTWIGKTLEASKNTESH